MNQTLISLLIGLVVWGMLFLLGVRFVFIWGPVGMLLSVPLTIVLKITLEQTNGRHNIAVLLSDLPNGDQKTGSDLSISQKKR